MRDTRRSALRAAARAVLAGLTFACASPATQPSAPGETLRTSQSERRDVRFACGDVRCAAWLYLPSGVERPPLVVMGHGLGCTRNMLVEPFANRFVSRGLAVLVFDYRYFGDSEGTPRQLIRIEDQLSDWRSALAYARTLPEVDPQRIGIWGTSFGGGHALMTAADEPDVRATIALVPFLDGTAGEGAGLGFGLRALGSALSDRTRRALGFSPYYIPVVGPPGTFAAINTETAYRAVQELVPTELGWRNEMTAGVMLSIGGYRPITRAAEIRSPLLVIAAREDGLIPFPLNETLVKTAPKATLSAFDGNHFSAYGGKIFDEMITVQVDFMAQHLGAGGASAGQ